MRIVGIVIGVILLVLLCSLPAHAQRGFLGGPGFHATPSCPPTHFRVIAVAGSEGALLPASFMPYDQAVALGSADSSHSVFMNYDQAIQKGLADSNPITKSPAEAAREYRLQRQHGAATEAKPDSAT